MDYTKEINFISLIENNITPAQISKVYQGITFLHKLPVKIQQKIATKSSKKDSYMGFVVEPYSFFLSFEITEKMVENYLPAYYELVPVSLFDGEKPRKCAILGCFNIHTSVFWGTRFELYIIAKNKYTNNISWIIADYESNTVNFDPEKGFLMPTITNSVFTISHKGDIICSFQNSRKENIVNFTAEIEEEPFKKLNRHFWVDANLSIDYSGELSPLGKDVFSLIFDPDEMIKAQKISLDKIEIQNLEFAFLNSEKKPFNAICFPYAQHL